VSAAKGKHISKLRFASVRTNEGSGNFLAFYRIIVLRIFGQDIQLYLVTDFGKRGGHGNEER